MEEKKLSYTIKRGKYTLECVHGKLEEDVSKFVAERYYTSQGYAFDDTLDELKEKMIEEDKQYIGEAYVYTVYDEEGTILGTIRKIIKLYNKKLPMEREFNINILDYQDSCSKMYEIARFTIKDSNPRVLNMLIREGLSECGDEELFVASLDANVLRGLKKIGFEWKQVKESKVYLGSESVPVILKKNKIKNRFVRNTMH